MHPLESGRMTGRTVRVPNKRYQRNGTKSYVHALLKYNITPTKPGPYYMGASAHQQGIFGTDRIGGRPKMHNQLMKRKVGHEDVAAPQNIPATDVQMDSEYLCPVVIGTPGQRFMLDFDTGSADLWVWSKELPKHLLAQYGKDHTVFDRKHSSTYRPSHSTWKIQYGDRSGADGNVGYDHVRIGNINVASQAVELAEDMSSSFAQGFGDGLLGLAFGKINTVQPQRVRTPIENMIGQHDISAGSELFTAYLGSYKDDNEADKGESFYTFGHIDADALSWHKVGLHDIHYAPIDNSNGFWEFPSTSAKVNGHVVHLGASNTAIADTGTTLALVSDELCELIYRDIKGARYDQGVQGYVFPKTATAGQLPRIEVKVGDNLFYIHKEDLAFADAGDGYVYGGVQSRGDLPLDVFGDTFLKGIYAIFDVGNKMFGAVQRIEKFQEIAKKLDTEEKKAEQAQAQKPDEAKQEAKQDAQKAAKDDTPHGSASPAV